MFSYVIFGQFVSITHRSLLKPWFIVWYTPILIFAIAFTLTFQRINWTNFKGYRIKTARVVFNVSCEVPSTELLKKLHWLPVKARIMFKVLVKVFRVISGTAPTYIRQMFHVLQGRYRRPSQSDTNFIIPRRRTKLADRSLVVVGSRWWNELPYSLRDIHSEDFFRSKLKTNLFNMSYG